jgi:hypothetical protein
MQGEPENDGCGFCDVLYKTQNAEGASGNSFQVILDTTNIVDNTFDTNPFDLITSTDLEFDLEQAPIGNQFQLYINANVYVITWAVDVVPSTGFDYVQVDNVYFVKVQLAGTDLDSRLNFRQMLIDLVDVNEGTTSSLTSTTFTIANMPTGSYLNNFAFVDSINTVTPSTNIGKYFYWNENAINYYHFLSAGTDIIFQFEETLNNAQLTLLKFYYNSVSSTFGLTITIDNGIDTPTVYTPTVGLGGIIEIEYTPTLTGTHTIELLLADPEDIESGFSLERFTADELIEVVSLDVEDCNGNITPFDYNYVYYTDIRNDNVILFDLADQYPDVFRFIITDSDDNTLTSRWYKVGDKDDCINGKLYSVKWTNTCNLGEIDYSGLPFTNELLLSGVLIKSQNELLDNVENVTASGKKVSIYKNTQSLYEFRLHPYLSDTFETILESIFMHDNVTINAVGYNATDTLQTSELDLQVYTGRVDLYKDGTNLISKNCC